MGRFSEKVLGLGSKADPAPAPKAIKPSPAPKRAPAPKKAPAPKTTWGLGGNDEE